MAAAAASSLQRPSLNFPPPEPRNGRSIRKTFSWKFPVTVEENDGDFVVHSQDSDRFFAGDNRETEWRLRTLPNDVRLGGQAGRAPLLAIKLLSTTFSSGKVQAYFHVALRECEGSPLPNLCIVTEDTVLQVEDNAILISSFDELSRLIGSLRQRAAYSTPQNIHVKCTLFIMELVEYVQSPPPPPTLRSPYNQGGSFAVARLPPSSKPPRILRKIEWHCPLEYDDQKALKHDAEKSKLFCLASKDFNTYWNLEKWPDWNTDGAFLSLTFASCSADLNTASVHVRYHLSVVLVANYGPFQSFSPSCICVTLDEPSRIQLNENIILCNKQKLKSLLSCTVDGANKAVITCHLEIILQNGVAGLSTPLPLMTPSSLDENATRRDGSSKAILEWSTKIGIRDCVDPESVPKGETSEVYRAGNNDEIVYCLRTWPREVVDDEGMTPFLVLQLKKLGSQSEQLLVEGHVALRCLSGSCFPDKCFTAEPTYLSEDDYLVLITFAQAKGLGKCWMDGDDMDDIDLYVEVQINFTLPNAQLTPLPPRAKLPSRLSRELKWKVNLDCDVLGPRPKEGNHARNHVEKRGHEASDTTGYRTYSSEIFSICNENTKIQCCLKLYPDCKTTDAQGQDRPFLCLHLRKCTTPNWLSMYVRHHLTITLNCRESKYCKYFHLCDHPDTYEKMEVGSEKELCSAKTWKKLIHGHHICDGIVISCRLDVLLCDQKPLLRRDTTEPVRYLKIFEDQTCADVTFNVQGQTICAHKCFLAANSPVFAEMFEREAVTSAGDLHNLRHKLRLDDGDDDSVTPGAAAEKRIGGSNRADFPSDVRKILETTCFQIEGVEYTVFLEMLRFIYSGEVSPNVYKMAMELLAAAEKYKVESLKEICEEVASENLSVETVVGILSAAIENNSDRLKANAIAFIKANKAQVLASDEWNRAKEKILLRIADDLI